jgi:beta-fructofuranosidase
VKFETPELKDGFEIEAYVNPNQISVFVNNGEAVITNAVYDLGKEIETDVKMRIETLEK